MCVVPPPVVPTAFFPEGAVYAGPDLIEAQQKANEAARARLEATFRQICGTSSATVWQQAEGDPATLLAQGARTSDLAVVPKVEEGSLEALEELLLASGVPVLMVPAMPPQAIGGCIVIGWNGSREATSAVHGALPFLSTAKEVVLIAVGDASAATLEPAAAMLHRHGVQASGERVAEPDDGAGETLLAKAAEHRADLLVLGAYGHTRLRELIFGGATRHVLRHAQLPVLFGS
jgi:nucleotide-binding universal stress UspA family protein